MFSVFCFLVFPSFSFAANDVGTLKSIGALLEGLVEKNTVDGTLQTIPGKAGVTSLFKKSLKSVKDRDMQVVDGSVKNITTEIQAEGSCATITTTDIVNILYYTANYGSLGLTAIPPFGIANAGQYLRDNSFRRLIDQTIAADKHMKIPTVQDRNISCMRLVSCKSIVGTEQSLTPSTQIRCENYVRDKYLAHMVTDRAVSTITEGSFGEDVFQNGTIEDSDYDLMVDIYNIGRLMFQSYTPPVELVYYQLPTVKTVGANNANQNNTLTGGPLITTSSQTKSTDVSANNTTFNVGGVTIAKTDTANPTIQGIYDEDPIDDMFIQETNKQASQGLTTAIGNNSCMLPQEIPGENKGPEKISFDEYTKKLDKYYATLAAGEEPDVSPQNLSNTSNPTNTNDPTKQAIVVEQEIVNTIQSHFDIGSASNTADTESCIANCKGLPAVDYALCTAKCLCGEVGNDAIITGGFEILPKDAFKVKFCEVAASSTPITRGRTILSIEEIFDEMRNIFVALKTSGELFKHVKTKEFLDSSMKKINFGKMFAFNIQRGSKGLSDNTPANNYKIQQEEINARLQKTLLKQERSIATSTERNKYIVIASPAAGKAALETNGTVDDLIQRIDKETESSNKIYLTADGIFNSDTQNAKTNMVNSQIADFFAANFQFRDEVIQQFADFNGIAENLRTKMQKAK